MATFSVHRELPLPPLDLYAVAIGDEFQRLRADELGGVGTPVVTPTDGGCHQVEMTRRVPAEALPGAVRKFLPKDAAATQVDTWREVGDDAASGTWRATVAGAPVQISGTYEVGRSAADTSRFTVTGDVRVSIPVVGGKIAGEVKKYLEQLAVKELDLIERHLAERAGG